MENLIKIETNTPTLDQNYFIINGIQSIDGYLFISFKNGKKILTNGNLYFDGSAYHKVQSILTINEIPHAVFTKYPKTSLVNLITGEVLFEEDFVYYIIKGTENLLEIIMASSEKTRVYDLERRQYIPFPKELPNYKLNHILENDLIVLEEDETKDLHKTKHAVINRAGQILLSDVYGGIYAEGNFIFIAEKERLTIIDGNSDSKKATTFEKGKEIIAKPKFITIDQIIILVFKDAVRIYDYNLKLQKEIPLDETLPLSDYDFVGCILKIAYKKGKSFCHTFINVKTGQKITHDYIEGFDYWNPTVFVARDYDASITHRDYEWKYMEELPDTKYSIYDQNLNFKKSFNARFCDSAFDNNHNLYCVITMDGEKIKRQVYVFSLNELKDLNAEKINSIASSPHSYTINSANEITFYNKDFEAVLPSFNLSEYSLKFREDDFSYFIHNGYLCMIIHIVNDFGKSVYRYILRNPNGETLIDSMSTQCRLIGDIIEITDNFNGTTSFLDTRTGMLGALGILLPTNESNIDIKKLNETGLRFAIEEKPASRERKKLDPPKE